MFSALLTAAYTSVDQAALIYAQSGLSVLPCKRDKTPAVQNWKHLQSRRATAETISLWKHTGLLESIGIICGEVSGGLIVVDCDGTQAVTEFRHRFPELANTYTVRSGSGQGAHFYLYAATIPPTTRVVGAEYGNIEMRSNGAYVIAPPSIHPSGNQYRVVKPTPVKRVPDLHELRSWIEAEIKRKHGGIMPPPANRPNDVINASRYAAAALDDECRAVSNATPGSRNGVLNRAAFKLGRLVREGKIDRFTVETSLFDAAAAHRRDDGDGAIMATIKAAVEAGIAKCGVKS